MRYLLTLAALPVLLLAGCAASQPQPSSFIGSTGQQVLDQVPKSQSVVEYNVAGLLHVGSADDQVSDQAQWRVVTACSNKGQLILGMIRDSAYMGSVKATAEKNGFKDTLSPQCS